LTVINHIGTIGGAHSGPASHVKSIYVALVVTEEAFPV
jgi:hypothetical protein